MNPPWIEFPELPSHSMGWRMGKGESYLDEWVAWLRGLNDTEMEQYANQWPEPEGWSGWFNYVNCGALKRDT